MSDGMQPVDQAAEPHTAARDFLAYQEERPDRDEEGIDAVRARHRREAMDDDRVAIEIVEETVVRANGHGIPIRLYSNDPHSSQPVLCWAHGGGFMFGSTHTEDATARLLAQELGCTVVSVDYRLAPEHPFPAGLRDVYAVLEWIEADGHQLLADRTALYVGGQSAGATLAVASSLLSRRRSGPTIDRQVLVVPVLSFSEDADRVDTHYLQDSLHGYNPLAHPLETDDVTGLPPATIVTAGFDEHRHDGDAYGNRLHDAGIDVAHHHYADTVHHFLTFAGEEGWPRGYEALTAIRNSLS